MAVIWLLPLLVSWAHWGLPSTAGLRAPRDVLPGEKRLTVLPQADSWHRLVTLVIFHRKVPSKEASSMRRRLCSSLPRAWSFWARVCCNSTTCGEAHSARTRAPAWGWGGDREVWRRICPQILLPDHASLRHVYLPLNTLSLLPGIPFPSFSGSYSSIRNRAHTALPLGGLRPPAWLSRSCSLSS